MSESEPEPSYLLNPIRSHEARTSQNPTPDARSESFESKEIDCEPVAEALTKALADTFVLNHTTQVCHWNVVGPQFHQLHDLFEAQYRDLSAAIDVIAEKVRTLGFAAPTSLTHYLELSDIPQPESYDSEREMLSHLIFANNRVCDSLRKVVQKGEQIKDEASIDLAVERLRVHEKAIWMLKSQAGVKPLRLNSTRSKDSESNADMWSRIEAAIAKGQ